MVSGERTVIVWARPYIVTIYKKSKTVWTVVGDYDGKWIDVQDATEAAALKRWREAAEHKQH